MTDELKMLIMLPSVLFLLIANLMLAVMMKRLRRIDTDLWERLGKPFPFRPYVHSRPRDERIALQTFVLNRQYRVVGDPKITLYGNVILGCLTIAATLVLVVVVGWLVT